MGAHFPAWFVGMIPLFIAGPLVFNGVYLYETGATKSASGSVTTTESSSKIKTGILVSDWDLKLVITGGSNPGTFDFHAERGNFEDVKTVNSVLISAELGWNCGENDVKEDEAPMCPDLRTARNIFFTLVSAALCLAICGFVVSFFKKYEQKSKKEIMIDNGLMCVLSGLVMILAWAMLALELNEKGPYEKSIELLKANENDATGTLLEGIYLIIVTGVYSSLLFVFSVMVIINNESGYFYSLVH